MNDNIIGDYLTAISAFELLTPEQEVDLAKKVQQGDMDARERFINCNLRLVVNIAKTYPHRGILTLRDYIQAGNDGLRKAVDRYDVGKLNPSTNAPYRFSTFAVYWIKQAINKEIADCGRSIRNPAHIIQQLSRYNQAVSEELSASGGARPSDEAIAEKLNCSVSDVENLRRWQRSCTSLDKVRETKVGHDDAGSMTLGDLIADDGPTPDQVAREADLKRLEQRFLTEIGKEAPRTEVIRRLRYGKGIPSQEVLDWMKDYGAKKGWSVLTASDFNCPEGMTLDEVGKRLNLTRERIRQIEKQTLAQRHQRFVALGYTSLN
nr:MAG TPA: DNA directed RNA polymerase subunit [Caudoviricetes sp.]